MKKSFLCVVDDNLGTEVTDMVGSLGRKAAGNRLLLTADHVFIVQYINSAGIRCIKPMSLRT